VSREVWAVVSDLHCGSTLGLCPESGVPLDDGGWYKPSDAQVKLWHCWLDYWATVQERLRPDDKLIVLINGDAFDGDHHRTAQILSSNLAATQHECAVRVLAPAVALRPAAGIVIRGTEVHVGESAQYEERLAKDLGAVEDPTTGAHSWWHFQAMSEGVLLDFSHHGRMGQRPWTKVTGPATMAAQILQAAAKHGSRHPDLVIRSHHHQEADSYDNFPVRVIQTRGWQLSTAFVHRIAAGALPEIGGLILTCADGEVDVEKVRYNWKREEPWRLTA